MIWFKSVSHAYVCIFMMHAVEHSTVGKWSAPSVHLLRGYNYTIKKNWTSYDTKEQTSSAIGVGSH